MSIIEKITSKVTGEPVKVPAPGRIVKIEYYNESWKLGEEWDKCAVTGIVLAHSDSYCDGEHIMSVLDLRGDKQSIVIEHMGKATSVRSLSAETRDVLKGLYKWYTSDLPKWNDKIKKLTEERDEARKNAGANDPRAAIAKSMNALTDAEFEAELNSLMRKKFGRCYTDDGWTCSFWGTTVSCRRSVDIQKYYTGSMAFMEYDGTLVLVSNCKETEEGQRLIKRHRRTLPVKVEMHEGFMIGDKNYLIYDASYDVGRFDDTALLTKELAAKIIDKFAAGSGKKRS